MDDNSGELVDASFQRRPGGRRGCGCCGFWLAGLAALPLLAIVFLIAVI